jgi:Flp pilus assembly protein TadD
LALTEFQIVLDGLKPDSAAAGDIHMRLGETYRRMDTIEAAIAEFRLAKNLLPDRESVVASALALCLDSAGRWEEAEREYQAAIRIDPNNAVSLNNLAYLLSQLTYAKRAAELMPQLPEVSDTLGTIYLAHGMNGAALDVFRQMLKRSPGNAEHMAMRLAEKGLRDVVLADLTAALARHGSKEDDLAIGEIMRKLR